MFGDAVSPLTQARHHLIAGRSIGIFPEGTVNRDRFQLLRGRHGAARLSLETGVPVVPAGIRFSPSSPVDSDSRMDIVVGPALPMPPASTVAYADVRARHTQIMSAIGRLAGKTWKDTGVQHAGDDQ
jgi:1-acyl-sn-glycerol-3-phosphate acyltransferase